MEVLTTVGILSKLPNSFPTRFKQVLVGIAYPHLQYAFTSWGKAPATYMSNKKSCLREPLRWVYTKTIASGAELKGCLHEIFAEVEQSGAERS